MINQTMHFMFCNITKMSIQIKRKCGNQSSINFAAFREPQIDPQHYRIYQRQSQISKLFNDFDHGRVKTQARFSQNIITSITQKHEVPQYQDSNHKKQNKGYLQFFDHHKVFVKPYASNTKYIDLINRNKLLIRHEQSRLIFQKDKSTKIQKKKTKDNRKYRFFRHTDKSQTLPISNINEDKNTQIKLFDKTISTQTSTYNTLYYRQRSLKIQSVMLSNSINRIIIAQNINKQLFPRSRQFHLTQEEL